MTDGQIKYQTLMENQRHNYEMEKIGEVESQAASRNAKVSEIKAAQAERELKMKEGKYDTELDLLKAQASIEWMKHGWNSLGLLVNALGATAKLIG